MIVGIDVGEVVGDVVPEGKSEEGRVRVVMRVAFSEGIGEAILVCRKPEQEPTTTINNIVMPIFLILGFI